MTGNIEFDVPLIKSKKLKMIWSFRLLITYLFIFFIFRKKMQNNKYLFTSEVSEGHPDKRDRISDMVVDYI